MSTLQCMCYGHVFQVFSDITRSFPTTKDLHDMYIDSEAYTFRTKTFLKGKTHFVEYVLRDQSPSLLIVCSSACRSGDHTPTHSSEQGHLEVNTEPFLKDSNYTNTDSVSSMI